ncbi:lipoate--protein ligase [Romboutsia lituseburensis]|uniref:lipoate--protein ligase n=1 Tax=Romboutsia lituseburensis DSM 797 TaxID=1121325 RepID=A0A1G9L1B6_9FIRM|nr:lipoate--protein ligase [Romboutsia lituseburensis]CEH35108.1 Lipoate-protein ligase LplJ [Romboutsia lituseburensis]SDL55739.1 lipoate-protein ligase A [Romboutsia lituseburensis DSM 797]
MLLIYNDKTNPYFNLAMEEYFLKNFCDDIFILWRNEPSIIVGKNQNTLSEINIEYVKENNIPVVRRQSGGGAVFHDLGNINFTFIANDKKGFSDFKRFTQPIINLLRTLDIDATFSGRNDLLIDGKKFSGNAQYNYKNRVMHHGTLLFSSQISDLSNALKVKPIKFEGKGIKSVKSRVTNIREHLKKDISILEFKDLIINYLLNTNSNNKTYDLTNDDIDNIWLLANNKYNSWEWNFGNSPKYSLTNQLKYPGGNVEFNLNVEKGIIKNIKFFGDFFGESDVSYIENLLVGIKHDEDSIKDALNLIDINNYFLGANIEILLSGILGVK